MRTTLDLDDDVLQAAKELAASRGLTAGQVVSALARKGLQAPKAGRLATFDRCIPRRAVMGAERDLVEVIAPV